MDYAIVFDKSIPNELLEVIRPAIHAKGGDYDVDAMPETPVVRRHGGDVVGIPFIEGRSTSGLIERIRRAGKEAERE